MPAVVKIDGVSLKGKFKLTPDSAGAPTVYVVVGKQDIFLNSTGTAAGSIYLNGDTALATPLVTWSSTTVNDSGGALATSAAVAAYIADSII